MTDFDKKVKKLSKEFQIPEGYDKRVREALDSIPDDDIQPDHRRGSLLVKIVAAMICLCLIGGLLISRAQSSEASLIHDFRESIMDFFGINQKQSEELGVDSQKEESVSKPDLMLELQEKVIDSQRIYLMVKITAPTNVAFADNIGFDYFCFCRGENYDTNQLLSGATSCDLLEIMPGKENVATYVVSLTSDQELAEGDSVTVSFKDLKVDPYGEEPEMLVEGMWSISFNIDYTVAEEISLKGTDDMVYPFVDTTAKLVRLKLTPLGLTVVSDVSNVDQDALGVSDTRIEMRLRMIDGSQYLVDSHDLEKETIVSSGSVEYTMKKNKTYQKSTFCFEDAILVEQVLGIYLEDCYIPFKDIE
ncbi:MAG: hypothetical protein Q4D32_04030 [Eubacteriales bacterium]|nr:hypothetical protein [Eubacteriales bacterium]